jgi:hypothetical protein
MVPLRSSRSERLRKQIRKKESHSNASCLLTTQAKDADFFFQSIFVIYSVFVLSYYRIFTLVIYCTIYYMAKKKNSYTQQLLFLVLYHWIHDGEKSSILFILHCTIRSERRYTVTFWERGLLYILSLLFNGD